MLRRSNALLCAIVCSLVIAPTVFAQDGPIRLPRVEKQIITPDQMGGLDLKGLRGGGLIDFSFNIGAAAGGATVDDETLLGLQKGHHDFNQRGFNLQFAELGIYGEVDPYLSAQAIMNMGFNGRTGETIVELEEAFFTTTAVGDRLEIRGGTFYADVGRTNSQHAHFWIWMDQPIINSRLFGVDGLRGPGVRANWLGDGDRYAMYSVGIHNAHGATSHSFLQAGEGNHDHGGGGHDEHGDEEEEEHAAFGSTIGGWAATDNSVRNLGDVLVTSRWETSWIGGPDDQRTWLLGLSGAFGPNNTGQDGYTQIYGLDLTMKWVPDQNERGWPYLIWQTEILGRQYSAAEFEVHHIEDGVEVEEDVEGRRLIDWGMYTQLMYGYKPNWALGVRYEYVNGRGDSLDGHFEPMSNSLDPTRDRRSRLSPMVLWTPSHFTRIRLQYNYDHAQHLDAEHSGESHGVWLGIDFMIGRHPAHRF